MHEESASRHLGTHNFSTGAIQTHTLRFSDITHKHSRDVAYGIIARAHDFQINRASTILVRKPDDLAMLGYLILVFPRCAYVERFGFVIEVLAIDRIAFARFEHHGR